MASRKTAPPPFLHKATGQLTWPSTSRDKDSADLQMEMEACYLALPTGASMSRRLPSGNLHPPQLDYSLLSALPRCSTEEAYSRQQEQPNVRSVSLSLIILTGGISERRAIQISSLRILEQESNLSHNSPFGLAGELDHFVFTAGVRFPDDYSPKLYFHGW